MFSGLVETVGMIIAIKKSEGCYHFTITPNEYYSDLMIGESISVNGVCLTVTDFMHGSFNVTLVPETLRLTNLSTLEIGSFVNLERSLEVGARIGGHYVQGHIDMACPITAIKAEGAALLIDIAIPKTLSKYIVKKGYVAIDGMSITVVAVKEESFTITLIPHTQKITIARNYTVNSRVNLEVDMLGKYVEKLLGDQHVLRN